MRHGIATARVAHPAYYVPRYDPYGNTTSASETVSNPFRFIGAIWESSTGLYKMGERYYDPSTARFTQLDPLGGGMSMRGMILQT